MTTDLAKLLNELPAATRAGIAASLHDPALWAEAIEPMVSLRERLPDLYANLPAAEIEEIERDCGLTVLRQAADFGPAEFIRCSRAMGYSAHDIGTWLGIADVAAGRTVPHERAVAQAQAAHEYAIEVLKQRYPWQFKALIHHGFAIGPGWLPEIEAVCAYLDENLLDPRERALFSWRQIKEKFGGLRMYYRHRLELPPAENSTEQAELAAVLELPSATRDMIHTRVNQAEQHCGQTCEICGQPGQLLKDDWYRVRCAEHAR